MLLIWDKQGQHSGITYEARDKQILHEFKCEELIQLVTLIPVFDMFIELV